MNFYQYQMWMKKDIFGKEIEIIQPKPEIKINGLDYIENWINIDEENKLISDIDKMPWENYLKRRVQQYGYIYDYRSAKLFAGSNKNDNYIGELPEFLKEIGKRLVNENIFIKEPEQVIINEYLPGQGINHHVDCLPCFKDIIVSLSLGSSCVMDFRKKTEVVHKKLAQRSLLIITGESRYEWSHGIKANSSDLIDGVWMNRNRRISLTFRNIK